MDRMESLEAEYPQLNFSYEHDMPKSLSGLILNKRIYINCNKAKTKQLETMGEELGHYETTVGRIVPVRSEQDRIQERRARRWGHLKLITLEGLIECYDSHLLTIDEVADYFEVSIDYFWEAIEDIRGKFGICFWFNGYRFDLSNGLNIQKG